MAFVSVRVGPVRLETAPTERGRFYYRAGISIAFAIRSFNLFTRLIGVGRLADFRWNGAVRNPYPGFLLTPCNPSRESDHLRPTSHSTCPVSMPLCNRLFLNVWFSSSAESNQTWLRNWSNLHRCYPRSNSLSRCKTFDVEIRLVGDGRHLFHPGTIIGTEAQYSLVFLNEMNARGVLLHTFVQRIIVAVAYGKMGDGKDDYDRNDPASDVFVEIFAEKRQQHGMMKSGTRAEMKEPVPIPQGMMK